MMLDRAPLPPQKAVAMTAATTLLSAVAASFVRVNGSMAETSRKLAACCARIKAASQARPVAG